MAKIVSMNSKVFFIYQVAGKKITDIMAVEVNPVDLTIGNSKIIANTSKAEPKSDLFELRNFLESYLAVHLVKKAFITETRQRVLLVLRT